jgi:molecular chaperone DnaJ
MADKKRDYYDVLGIHKGASEQEIKTAFKKKAMQYHPDRNEGDKGAEEKFKEVNEAYAILSDKEKKDLYDRYGHAGVDPNAGFGGGGGGFGGFSGFSGFQGVDINIDDLGDIFGSFFQGRGGKGGRTKNAARPGADMQHQVHISFEEAAFGVKKEIILTKDTECPSCKGTGAKNGTAKETCKTCGGTGRVQRQQKTPFGVFSNVTTCPDCHGTGEKILEACDKCKGRGIITKKVKININIPAGVDNGTILPIQGQGEPGRNGGPAGDLYVILSVSPHRFFKRDGQNLYLECPITFSEAALGGSIIVPTLKEKVKQKIPAGTQSGQIFRLKGKGMKYIRGNKTGDLYIKMVVETPTRLSGAEKELLRKFEETSEKNYPKKQRFKDTVKSTT